MKAEAKTLHQARHSTAGVAIAQPHSPRRLQIGSFVHDHLHHCSITLKASHTVPTNKLASIVRLAAASSVASLKLGSISTVLHYCHTHRDDQLINSYSINRSHSHGQLRCSAQGQIPRRRRPHHWLGQRWLRH
jgi:hypothetical protein